MGDKRTNKPAARVTFFQRGTVLAETILRHPKSESERQEAARVVELMRREEAKSAA